jgi:hypothetical protein
MKNRYYFLAYIFLFLVIGGFQLGYVCRERIRNGPRLASIAQLRGIGAALRSYQTDHGAFPAHLSDLVPKYVTLDHLAVFYVRNNSVQLSAPPDWSINPQKIDEYSAYAYVGTNGGSSIIAFEKTNLWNAGVIDAGNVAALFADFHVEPVSVAKLQNSNRSTNAFLDRLSKGF